MNTLMSVITPLPVRCAILLLWGALVLAFVPALLDWETFSELGLTFGMFMTATSAVIIALNAAVIHFVSRQRNWARIVVLIFAVAHLAMFAFWPSDWKAEDPWWLLFLEGSILACELAAVVLLYSGAGSKWFAARTGRHVEVAVD